MKKIILIFCLLLTYTVTKATNDPNWTVNAGAFQYTMTVTGVANIACVELANNTTKIGAFVGGVCRGVVQTNVISNSRNYGFLIARSNVSSGETVTFKIYNSVTDVVYDAVDVVTFASSSVVGTVSNPFAWRTNHAPSDIAISGTSLAESLPLSSFIANLSTTDADVSDAHTYTLTTGMVNNNQFAISGNQLISNAVFSYETAHTRTVEIKTDDGGGCSITKQFTIAILNVNDPPTALVLSDTSMFENTLNPTIGSFTATDLDATDVFTYSFVNGAGDADNGNFSITGASLAFTGSADYETKNTYSIRCRVTDAGGLFFERVFTIVVKDKNDNPTDLLLSNTKVFENEPADQFVAKLSTVDQDVWDKFTYTFANVGTNNNTSFAISGDTLKANQAFDFETKNNYQVYLTTTDSSGVSFTRSYNILIKDTLDAPTDIMVSNASLPENAPFKTFVGKLTTVDANFPGPNIYVYSLTAGLGSSDNGAFMISNDSIYSQGMFDFETKNLYSLRLKTTLVNGMFVEKAIMVSVLNEIDTVQNILLSNNTIDENNLSGVQVAVLTSVSQDNGGLFIYNLVSGTGATDNASFAINGSNLTFTDTADFELQNSYSIRISSTNGLGKAFEKAFVIQIIDKNDNPTNSTLSNNLINENAGANSLIGTITTTDQDTWDSFTYDFDNSVLNDNASFTLLNTGGLFATASFDFETKKSYTISVKSTDAGGLTFVKQFNIHVVDINEIPTALNSSTLALYENLPVNTLVGTFTTTDVDTLDAAAYTLVSGTGSTDNASFTISNNQLLSAVVFDYEQKNQYAIRVRTIDNGGLYIERAFLVAIKDTNELPTLITLSYDSITENNLPSSVVCVLTTTDQEGGSNFIYTTVAGAGDADNAEFSFNGNELVLVNPANFEAKNTYNLRIKTTDISGGSLEMPFVIYIKDTNELPSINIADYAISENSEVGAEVGKVTVAELDSNQTQKFKIISSGIPFVIDSLTGIISLQSLVDYETQKEYRILISTTDDGALPLSDTALIKITVLDGIEDDGFFPSVDFVSPNNDGKNDFWQITNVELYKDFSLKIADQNGQEVYKTDSNYNNDWNAFYKGSALPSGNYYYLFSNPNTGRAYKGTITVVK